MLVVIIVLYAGVACRVVDVVSLLTVMLHSPPMEVV